MIPVARPLVVAALVAAAASVTISAGYHALLADSMGNYMDAATEDLRARLHAEDVKDTERDSVKFAAFLVPLAMGGVWWRQRRRKEVAGEESSKKRRP